MKTKLSNKEIEKIFIKQYEKTFNEKFTKEITKIETLSNTEQEYQKNLPTKVSNTRVIVDAIEKNLQFKIYIKNDWYILQIVSIEYKNDYFKNFIDVSIADLG